MNGDMVSKDNSTETIKKGSKPKKNKPDANNPESNTNDGGEAPKVPSPNLPESEGEARGLAAQKAKEQQRQTNENLDPMVSLTRRMVWWTGALFFAAIGTDVFMYFQWDEMSKSNKLAADTLVSNQRAWLAARGVTTPSELVEGQDFSVMVEYRNVGREPAIKVGNSVIYVSNNGPPSTKPKTMGQETKNQCTVAAQGVKEMTIYPSDNSYYLDVKTKILLPVADILAGQRTLTIEGCFVYETFRVAKESRFCFFADFDKVAPSKSLIWHFCPSGNEAN